MYIAIYSNLTAERIRGLLSYFGFPLKYLECLRAGGGDIGEPCPLRGYGSGRGHDRGFPVRTEVS